MNSLLGIIAALLVIAAIVLADIKRA